MVEDNEEVRDLILQLFRSHWTTPWNGDDNLQGSHPTCSISDEKNIALTHILSAIEMCQALWSLDEDKISGRMAFLPSSFVDAGQLLMVR